MDAFGGNGRRTIQPSKSEIRALSNVSFEVKEGDVVGIIGRNGAGKSTLLKIIARITEPTEGSFEIFGRVGCLLEVGAGFHPELNGRENIYLNGAILGMNRAEINQRFDEIVAFSEVGDFLDLPLKHFSSGMYVRLAFAVAAHLNPQILLVDEVLAVGDLGFQKKCLGKMNDLAKSGRTVLFVSHNIPAIERLCQKAILLDQGNVIASGDVLNVTREYYKSMQDRNGMAQSVREIADGTVRFTEYSVGGGAPEQEYACFTGEPLTIRLSLFSKRKVRDANFGIALFADDGTLIWAMSSLDHGRETVILENGKYVVEFGVPLFPLKPGTYQILVSANDLTEGTLDEWYPKPSLTVLPQNESGRSMKWQGILNLQGEFNISKMVD